MRSAVLAACLAAAQVPARAQSAGTFGAGVEIGNPTGMTGKYFLDNRRAVDVGIGYSGQAAFYADYLIHFWDVLPRPPKGLLGLYAGAGPRLEGGHPTRLGLRTMGGAVYQVSGQPVEVFLEAGPVWQLVPDAFIELDWGLGVHFYFQ